MKKIGVFLLITLFSLTSCSTSEVSDSTSSSDEIVYDYTLIREVELDSYYKFFSQEEDSYYVYYFSESCQYCKKVYPYINEYLNNIKNNTKTYDINKMYTLDHTKEFENVPLLEMSDENGKPIEITEDIYEKYIIGVNDPANLRRIYRPYIWIITTVNNVKTITGTISGSNAIIEYFSKIN